MPEQLISIVIPVYNEEEVIDQTLDRIMAVVASVEPFKFELILVDDGSTDSTLELLEKRRLLDSRVRIVALTRNFGHQIAVSAGLRFSAGHAVIVMDADLQDPPEVMSEFLENWQNGYDIVYAVRSRRLGEPFFKRLSAWVFYRVMDWSADVSIPHDTGDFRLLSRRVVDAMNAMPEHARYLRGLMSWTGYSSTAVTYLRQPRVAGSSKYPFRKMTKLASEGIFSLSTKPLQAVVAVGMIVSAISILASVWFALSKFLFGLAVPGWTGLIVAISFLGGVQILALGVVGTYIGGIFNEVRGRPLYFVNFTRGF